MHRPLRSIAAADLTGQGEISLLLADEYAVRIYSPAAEELILTGTVETNTGNTLIQIDTFDINNNGRAEIYVNSYANDRANSFVAEYTDGTYVRIAEKMPLFFRTYPDSDGKTIHSFSPLPHAKRRGRGVGSEGEEPPVKTAGHNE